MVFVGDSALGFREQFLLKFAGAKRTSMDQPQQPTGDDPGREAARLVAAMAKGDRDALARLYDQLSRPVYSLVYRLLGDAAEAQDVVQDIFLQVWRTAAEYETTRGSVFSWIVTLARNRAIDRLRMRRRRTELLEEAAPDLQPANGQAPDSADALGLREQAEAVRAALGRLPGDQKQAIELAYFGSLTQQEIAQRLNEPLGTIKARIRRGLLRLKSELPVKP